MLVSELSVVVGGLEPQASPRSAGVGARGARLESFEEEEGGVAARIERALSERSKISARLQADEALLRDSIDYGEWALARESRLAGVGHTPSESGLLGEAFMTWMVRIVREAWRGPIERDGLPGLRTRYLSCNLYAEFVAEWERAGGDKGGRAGAHPSDVEGGGPGGTGARRTPPRFQLVLLRIPAIRRTLVWGSLSSGMQGLLGTVARPIVLAVIVNAVNNDAGVALSVAYVFLFGAVVFFEGWLGNVGRQLLSEEFGTQFQNAASSAVYAKMLRIDTQKAGGNGDRASESSLIGNDVVRAYENIRTASTFPMALTGVLGGIAVLLVVIGAPALVGIVIMVTIMFGNVGMGKVTHSIEQKNLRFADERLSVLGQVVDSIRAVKLFGWEKSYMAKLTKIRDEECTHIRNYRLAHVTSISTGRASPVLSSTATLLFYALSGNELTIAVAYATVSVFQALRLGLIYIPLSVSSFMALDVTCKRLNSYLAQPERREPRRIKRGEAEESGVLAEVLDSDLGWEVSETPAPAAMPEPPPAPALAPASPQLSSRLVKAFSLRRASSSRGGAKAVKSPKGKRVPFAVLDAVTLRVREGQVIGVVGAVGSGKSTLLASVCQAIAPLGTGPAPAAGVRSVRSIGYAPQKPFVVCGTIKQNLLLGRRMDYARLQEILCRSGLETDLMRLPHGVQTEIGERGTTLSGGQQSRLGVARALYSDPALLVLDDPLAAVDSKVCNHMFEEAILAHVKEPAAPGQPREKGAPRKGRGCLLALNQLALLPRVDWVVFLDKGGVGAQGSYAELMESDAAFRAFVATFQASHEDERSAESEQRDTGDMVKTAPVQHPPSPAALLSAPPASAPTIAPPSDKVDENNMGDGGPGAGAGAATAAGTDTCTDAGMGAIAGRADGGGDGGGTVVLVPASSILEGETGRKGVISSSIYLKYIGAMGFAFSAVCALLSLAGYVVMAINDAWLTLWSRSLGAGDQSQNSYYAAIYAALSMVFAACILTASWMMCFGGVRASRKLHNAMLTRLLQAPMYWFENTATGRIISRFSGDLSKVDMILSLSVDNLIQILCTLLVLLAVICVAVPVMTALIAVCAAFFVWLLIALDRTSREIKRMSNNAMGPLLSNAAEAVRGREMILAMGCTEFFEARHRLASDEYARANFASGAIINWGTLASNLLTFIVSIAACSLLVGMGDKALIGLTLAYGEGARGQERGWREREREREREPPSGPP